ncbi:hypothetical protein K8I85_08390 [bacterium]|nr:hypothetical protein [bacterium]
MSFRRKLNSSLFKLSIAAALLPFAVPGICFGQTLFQEGRSLEFRTDEDWSRIRLEGREEINGVSPLRVPGPLKGEFWLSAWGPGAELQRGRVEVQLDGNGAGILSYGRRGFGETVLQSLLYPGLVQHGQGQEGKGYYMGTAAAVGVIGTLVAEVELWRQRDLVEKADREYHAAATSSERHDLLNIRQDRREDRDHAVDRRTVWAIGTATVWGVGLLDAVFFSPDFRVRSVAEGSMTLGMKRKSRFHALSRSLLFPGLGQEYNGEYTKSAWVATGAALAGVWMMNRQDEYAKAVTDYRKAHHRFLAAQTVEEQENYAGLQEDRYNTVEDRKRDRDVAIGILGGYWLLSMVETALSFDESWGSHPVRQGGSMGLMVDPMEGAVAAQWKF